jgi:hypothetical protein
LAEVSGRSVDDRSDGNGGSPYWKAAADWEKRVFAKNRKPDPLVSRGRLRLDHKVGAYWKKGLPPAASRAKAPAGAVLASQSTELEGIPFDPSKQIETGTSLGSKNVALALKERGQAAVDAVGMVKPSSQTSRLAHASELYTEIRSHQFWPVDKDTGRLVFNGGPFDLAPAPAPAPAASAPASAPSAGPTAPPIPPEGTSTNEINFGKIKSDGSMLGFRDHAADVDVIMAPVAVSYR